MIDLSFTEDPEWLATRTQQWQKVYKTNYYDSKESDLGQLKAYFFKGECTFNRYFTFVDKCQSFPLPNSEGWDYVVQHVLKDAKEFRSEMYKSLNDTTFFLEPAQDIALMDYFHPKVFQPTIKSRVPVGKTQEYVEVDCDPFRIAFKMIVPIDRFLEGIHPCGSLTGEDIFLAKWCVRAEYFLSCLPFLDFDTSAELRGRDPRAQLLRVFPYFAHSIHQPRLQKPMSDELNQYREQLVAKIKAYIDNTDNLPQWIQDEWHKAKNNSDVTMGGKVKVPNDEG